jgi:hypothetical protein
MGIVNRAWLSKRALLRYPDESDPPAQAPEYRASTAA